ncbi:MAG: glycosyltransferase family 39 protein [Bacteroidales bacterium]|nr:glycosyltransferase family 39 protein [Bacteroidales bacterium]
MIRKIPWVVLASVAILSLFILPSLFREGMFLDGVIYASVARNMAAGEGTFWIPRYTEVVYRTFHEHPPLAIGIQSLFFRAFGDHLWVEKGYSFLVTVLNLLLVIRLTRAVLKPHVAPVTYLPLLLLAVTPLFSWCMRNNLIENTYSLFTLLSVLFFVKAKKRPWIWLTASGSMIFLAFLTKGVVTLYPLAVPFISFIVYRKDLSFRQMWVQTGWLFIVFILLTCGMFLLFSDARILFSKWFENQLLLSITGGRGVTGRFYILGRLVQELLPSLLLIVTFYCVAGRSKTALPATTELRHGMFFLFIALSATLPLMVSLKQHDYYFVPALPFYALAFTSFSQRPVERMALWFNQKLRFVQLTRYFMLASIAGILLFSIVTRNTPLRDRDMLHDIKIIGTVTGSHSYIRVDKPLMFNYGLNAYLQRYYSVTLQYTSPETQWYLCESHGEVPEGYMPVNCALKNYILYRKNS